MPHDTYFWVVLQRAWAIRPWSMGIWQRKSLMRVAEKTWGTELKVCVEIGLELKHVPRFLLPNVHINYINSIEGVPSALSRLLVRLYLELRCAALRVATMPHCNKRIRIYKNNTWSWGKSWKKKMIGSILIVTTTKSKKHDVDARRISCRIDPDS